MFENVDESYETTAKLDVKRFVTTKLYPTDTPDFKVYAVNAWGDGVMIAVLLTTTLPDGMLYFVQWEKARDDDSRELKAYKELDKDLSVH